MAVGAIILNENKVLLVYNRRPGGGGHWSLPKGSCETGEPLVETLRREVQEETGLLVDPVELAFVSEFFVSTRREWYLQHYFHVQVTGGVPGVQAKDPDVTAVKWVPVRSLGQHLTFRPWLEPLQAWLAERRPRYHLFERNEQKSRRPEPEAEAGRGVGAREPARRRGQEPGRRRGPRAAHGPGQPEGRG